MNEIIDYTDRGFTEVETLRQLKILQRVMCQTTTKKIGRGKKATEIEIFVYDDESDKEVRNRINKSIKHYETKLETLSEKNN